MVWENEKYPIATSNMFLCYFCPKLDKHKQEHQTKQAHPGKQKLKLLLLASVNIAVGEGIKYGAREGGGVGQLVVSSKSVSSVTQSAGLKRGVLLHRQGMMAAV